MGEGEKIMSRDRYRGDHKQFRISAKGLREWAKDVRDQADAKAKKLEKLAAELDSENGHQWPQSGEVANARR